MNNTNQDTPKVKDEMIKFQQIMSASVTTEGANSCMTEKIEVQGKFENEAGPIKHTISE